MIWTSPGTKAYGNFPIALHNAYLNILRTRLHNLQQTLHSQFDAFIPCQIVFVVLLQEFTDGFGGATNGVRLSIEVINETKCSKLKLRLLTFQAL